MANATNVPNPLLAVFTDLAEQIIKNLDNQTSHDRLDALGQEIRQNQRKISELQAESGTCRSEISVCEVKTTALNEIIKALKPDHNKLDANAKDQKKTREDLDKAINELGAPKKQENETKPAELQAANAEIDAQKSKARALDEVIRGLKQHLNDHEKTREDLANDLRDFAQEELRKIDKKRNEVQANLAMKEAEIPPLRQVIAAIDEVIVPLNEYQKRLKKPKTRQEKTALLPILAAKIVQDLEAENLEPKDLKPKNLEPKALAFALKIWKAMQWPLPFSLVLFEELSLRDPSGEKGKDTLNGPFQAAHRRKLLGLAFSGGGIRSATFNLGVLQALAQLEILPCIDYLSTVSGGGYIGSWFLAWLKRAESSQVMKQLDPDWNKHGDGKATPQIEFLRDYSNYLTPQVGAMSADTWTAIAVVSRNVLLNLTIMISLFVGVLLVPQLLTNSALEYSGEKTFFTASALLAASFLLFAVHLSKAWMEHPAWVPSTQGWVLVTVLAPFFVGTYFEICAIHSNQKVRLWGHSYSFWEYWSHPSWLYVIVALGAILFIWVGMGYAIADPGKKWYLPWIIWGLAVLSYLVLAFPAGVWILHKLAFHWPKECLPYHLMVWGLPAVMLINLMAAGLQVGLAGLLFRSGLREWTGRLGAWILILTLAWLALFGIAFYGPLWVIWAWGWITATVTLAWLAHTISGVLAGFSSRTGKPGAGGGLETLAKTAAPVFVIGLLVLLSFGIYKLLPPQGTLPHKAPASVQMTVFWSGDSSTGAVSVSNPKKAQTIDELAADYWGELRARPSDPFVVTVVFPIALMLAFLLSNRVDINDFSLNRLYRDRLVRCYLGASRPPDFGTDPNKRDPNPFTGFDPKDDFPLAELTETSVQKGPYPLLNTTLNLTHGERLAWQERKGE